MQDYLSEEETCNVFVIVMRHVRPAFQKREKEVIFHCHFHEKSPEHFVCMIFSFDQQNNKEDLIEF